jgi:hypothetical protein
MLKRGYIILIAGGVLLVTGLVLSIFSVGSFAGQFMRENIVLSQTIVRPSESIDATLQINDTTRPVSVALHSEVESANASLRESIRDPNGRIVNSNEFSKDFFTTFKPNMTGEYTLLISNLGLNDVNIDGIFGFIPFVGGGEDQVNLSSLNSIVTGVIVFIIGIIVLIAGIIIVILDRRREKRRPPLTH